MADERQGSWRGLKVLAAAAVAGLLAGSVAVYVMASGQGNGSAQATAACAGTDEAIARVEPTIKGNLAAFRVADEAQPLTDIAFKDSDGEEITLAAFNGRTVLLNLWATWCVPCRVEMPTLDRLQAELGGEDFEVVAVSIDINGEARARAFLDELGIEHLAFYADPTADVFTSLKRRGLAFGLPTTILFDPEGCRVGGVDGPAEWDSDDAKAVIRAALG